MLSSSQLTPPKMFRAHLPKCSPAICARPNSTLVLWLIEASAPCRPTSQPTLEEESRTTQLGPSKTVVVRMPSPLRRNGLKTKTSLKTPMNTVISASSSRTKSPLEAARGAIFHQSPREQRITASLSRLLNLDTTLLQSTSWPLSTEPLTVRKSP